MPDLMDPPQSAPLRRAVCAYRLSSAGGVEVTLNADALEAIELWSRLCDTLLPASAGQPRLDERDAERRSLSRRPGRARRRS